MRKRRWRSWLRVLSARLFFIRPDAKRRFLRETLLPVLELDLLLFAHSRQSDIDRLEPTAAHAHIYPMKRRTFIAGSTALAALGLASAGHAQGAEELARIDTYLNAMREAGGRFVQFNSDGSRSEGELWIRKPGLMRFEYDAPHSHVVISDGVTRLSIARQLYWIHIADQAIN